MWRFQVIARDRPDQPRHAACRGFGAPQPARLSGAADVVRRCTGDQTEWQDLASSSCATPHMRDCVTPSIIGPVSPFSTIPSAAVATPLCVSAATRTAGHSRRRRHSSTSHAFCCSDKLCLIPLTVSRPQLKPNPLVRLSPTSPPSRPAENSLRRAQALSRMPRRGTGVFSAGASVLDSASTVRSCQRVGRHCAEPGGVTAAEYRLPIGRKSH